MKKLIIDVEVIKGTPNDTQLGEKIRSMLSEKLSEEENGKENNTK